MNLLHDFVEVERRFLRSTNVSRDLAQHKGWMDMFLLHWYRVLLFRF